MMQRDGRGEAVLMPLGDRFGDPISESAALRATFLERPCASGLRSTVDHSRFRAAQSLVGPNSRRRRLLHHQPVSSEPSGWHPTCTRHRAAR